MQLLNPQKILRDLPPQGPLPTVPELFKTTLHIAWPSILESFLISLVAMVDTIMVGALGSYAIAAVGLTNQPKLIFLAPFLSLNVAVSAIVARRRGENDREGANRVLMQALLVTLLLTVAASLLAIAFADPILRIAGTASDTHAEAVAYFRIILGGFLFSTVSMVINAAQRGAGNTKIAMRTNLISNLINVFFNYLLIGGNLGFPRLGMRGAAIATVIGSVFACGMSLRSLSHPDQFVFFHGLHHLRADRVSLKSLAVIGSSTFAEQAFLRIGFLIYAAIVARLGTQIFASHQIGMNLLTLSFSFGDGLSVAAVALVGRSLGEHRQDLAKLYGACCQRTGIAFSLLLLVVFLSLGRPIFLLFSREAAILDASALIMPFLSVITLLQISQVVFSGCLRGAGDTVYIAFVGFISVALLRPFCGWLFCYPLGLGLAGAWLGITVDQFMRFFLTFLRFRSGRWMHYKI